METSPRSSDKTTSNKLTVHTSPTGILSSSGDEVILGHIETDQVVQYFNLQDSRVREGKSQAKRYFVGGLDVSASVGFEYLMNVERVCLEKAATTFLGTGAENGSGAIFTIGSQCQTVDIRSGVPLENTFRTVFSPYKSYKTYGGLDGSTNFYSTLTSMKKWISENIPDGEPAELLFFCVTDGNPTLSSSGAHGGGYGYNRGEEYIREAQACIKDIKKLLSRKPYGTCRYCVCWTAQGMGS